MHSVVIRGAPLDVHEPLAIKCNQVQSITIKCNQRTVSTSRWRRSVRPRGVVMNATANLFSRTTRSISAAERT